MALILGLDTGGTFTDAALLDADAHKVVAHAKALTTRYNLSIGVGEAMATVLEGWGGNKADISLVSLSTTLATNAVVESVGGACCLILIGFDDQILDRAGLREALGNEPYEQVYLHVFRVVEGQIRALIEGFDTALANRALWADAERLQADAPFSLDALSGLGFPGTTA